MTMNPTLARPDAVRTALSDRTRFQAIALLISLSGQAILLVLMLHATNGVLNYTLDDPYIHLALAEHLVDGHYGINVGENASPSSSILYPFLVAAGLLLGLGQYAPLGLNIIGALGCAWLLSGLLWDALGKSTSGRVPMIGIFALPFLLLSINGYALGFTGMEHTLHIWASLAIIHGLIAMGRNGAAPLFLLVACVVAPLLRFEGVALSGAALIAIGLHGHWRSASATGALIVALFTTYVTVMLSLGLPPMPSSVMVKSGPTAAVVASRFDAIAFELLYGLKSSLTNRQGVILAGLIVLALLGTIKGDRSATSRSVAYVAIAAGAAHLLVGRYDWFFRYEVYIIATLIAANLHIWAPVLGAAKRRIATPALLILVLPIMGYTYFVGTTLTPSAARNIYEQQFQMHRFSTEYFVEPVAVVDLGWVAYDNPSYVLDLWGLGNEEARQAYRTEGRTPAPLRRLTQKAGVSYVMLFEEVFPDGLPAEWCLIGQLDTPVVTSSHGTVEFFLIDPAKEEEMRSAIHAFAATLPERVSLETFGC